MTRLARIAVTGATALALTFLAVCSCSIVQTDPRDLVELERVWQYLNVYSIYRDRLPQNPVRGFYYPEELTAAFHDTLRYDQIVPFTLYCPPPYANSCVEEIGHAGAGMSRQQQSPVLYHRFLSDSTLYISIPDFGYHDNPDGTSPLSTTAQLVNLGTSLGDSIRVPNLIIDLENNPGGYIDICTSMVELLLPAGNNYLNAEYRVYDPETREGRLDARIWRSYRSGSIWENKKIAVLINENSASAAEIMAAALADAPATRAYLVGTTSYGKGIGQYAFKLASGAGLKITGFYFYRIIADSAAAHYNKKGIVPDTTLTTATAQIRAAGAWLEGPGFSASIKTPALTQVLAHKSSRYASVSPLSTGVMQVPDREIPVF